MAATVDGEKTINGAKMTAILRKDNEPRKDGHEMYYSSFPQFLEQIKEREQQYERKLILRKRD